MHMLKINQRKKVKSKKVVQNIGEFDIIIVDGFVRRRNRNEEDNIGNYGSRTW